MARNRTQYGWGQFVRRGYLRSNAIAEDTTKTESNVDISISTSTGGILGKIRTDVQNSTVQDLSFTISQDGGCADATLFLNKLPRFPIVAGSILTINFNNSTVPFWTGSVTSAEGAGIKKRRYKIRATGFRKQLKNVRAEKTYSSAQDIGAIVDDLVKNHIEPNTDINHVTSKINLVTGTLTTNDIDLSKASADKILDSLATMANHHWFIDGNGDFNFQELETTQQRVFFVGYDVNEVDIERNFDAVRNRIIVKRQQATGAGYTIAATANSDTSIAVNGLKVQNVQVPGNFGDEECQLIASKILEQKKDPKYSADIKKIPLLSKDDYMNFGAYRVVFPNEEYVETINQCEHPSEWSVSSTGGDLAVTSGTVNLIEGVASLKLDYSVSSGEIITHDLPSTIKGSPVTLRFYARTNEAGSLLTAGVGQNNWNDNTWTVDFPVKDSFFPVDIDVSSISGDINHIGFQLKETGTLAQAKTINLDKIEVLMKGHRHYVMNLETATYNFSPSSQHIDIELNPVVSRHDNYMKGLLNQIESAELTGEVR